MKQKILVVEDDKKTAELLRLYLERDDYAVLTAFDGRQALEAARLKRPDLIILDLMLPEIDGWDVCRVIRKEADTPIIMLTARVTEEDKLRGLDLGADDYVVKPFSPLEVVARVRAVLRRAGEAQSEAPSVMRLGDLTIDSARHEIYVGKEPVYLTPKEFRLLEILAGAPGRVFSRTELLEQAFGFDYEGLERTVDVHIMNLRRKLEPDPSNPTFVQTVYGIGYKLAESNHVA